MGGSETAEREVDSAVASGVRLVAASGAGADGSVADAVFLSEEPAGVEGPPPRVVPPLEPPPLDVCPSVCEGLFAPRVCERVWAGDALDGILEPLRLGAAGSDPLGREGPLPPATPGSVGRVESDIA